ncbi:hypothetical protein MAMP_00138 [Methylophaga aminisulfidivorans MP]|uniref:Uncharacterized protein n=1 Tax=Methylophaga aminisulfidivorans MP TaxID=1026882 RepID=F5T1F6_9GAMM|nr:hypothetical protein MAMP_00138 [Methylophaga aminisulfidivorans MP]
MEDSVLNIIQLNPNIIGLNPACTICPVVAEGVFEMFNFNYCGN